MKNSYNAAIIAAVITCLSVASGCKTPSDDNLGLLLALLGSNTPGSTSVESNCVAGGDCFIFKSATTTYGALGGGIPGADTICNSDSNKPNNGSTYKAMVVSGTTRKACTNPNCSGGVGEHIDWVLKPGTKYIRTNGQEVFTTTANGVFEFGLLSNPIWPDPGYAWTGLNTNWTTSTTNCLGWTAGSSSYSGRSGDIQSTTSSMISSANVDCNQKRNLYCVEQ